MNNQFGNGTIESINPNRLTEADLLKMYEIERDTWAYFMGEYVACKNCNEVFSKSDIYEEVDSDYKDKSVSELEQNYGRENIECKCCSGKTEDIRGENLIEALELRIFGAKQSFVNFYRGSINEILGFSYGFLDTPEEIYEKEFQYHFSKKLLDALKEKIGKTDLLTLSGVCFKQNHISINSIYHLIKYYFYSIESDKDYTVIGEAIKGTPSHKIYIGLGGKSLPLTDDMFKNTDFIGESKIIYGTKITETSKQIKDMSLKDFLKFTKKRVGNI